MLRCNQIKERSNQVRLHRERGYGDKMTRMVKLYEGTLNKLDYASTKVHNMLNQFWIDGKVYD